MQFKMTLKQNDFEFPFKAHTLSYLVAFRMMISGENFQPSVCILEREKMSSKSKLK